MARCPGQDMQFWKPEDIYEVACPNCQSKVEFWKDDIYRRCRKCGTRFRNPKLDLGCAQWCQYAQYCLGRNVAEIEKYAPCAGEDKIPPATANPPVTPEAGHPIRTMMEEHQVILGYLEKLRELLETLHRKDSSKENQHDLTLLAGIAHHLLDAENHHRREEEVIFPLLEQYGITGPPAVMRQEHIQLRQRKKTLAELAEKPPVNYAKFIREVDESGQYLVEELARHISKEDNILYPAALKAFKPEEWDEIKRKCDEIGYCCFTPQTSR